MTNIRGKLGKEKILKIPFDEGPEELNECCNCEGCLLEEFCREEDEKYFGKEGD